MQIFGASVAQAIQGFLHPGYISAYPRTFQPEIGYPIEHSDPVIQLDLVEALRLQDEVLASAQDVGTPVTTAMAGFGSLGGIAMGVLVFFGGLALVAALRRRHGPGRHGPGRHGPGRHGPGRHGPGRHGPGWRSPAPWHALPLVLFCGFLFTCGPPPLPTKVPWKDVTLRSYADPEQATLAILHGIVADGIINAGQPVSTLPNIQNEVALPTATPTEGMRYALQTYGLDGWGQEMRLTRSGSVYTVTSAGPDGLFDTTDDLRMRVQQANNESWDQLRHAFYLRPSGGAPVLLVHRFPGDHFKYANVAAAEALTGARYFDLAYASDLSASQADKVSEAWSAMSSGASHEPLVLQVFRIDCLAD